MEVTLATTVTIQGGVMRHVEDVATGLAARGHLVRIAAPADSRVARDLAARLGLPFRSLGEGPPAGGVWHLHLADTFDRQALPLLRQARRSRCVTVVSEHLPRTNASDPTLTGFRRKPGAYTYKSWLKRAQLRHVDRVVCMGESSLDFLVSRYGAAPERLAVVPPGVGSRATGPVADSGGRRGVLAVGALNAQKGHDVLIRAAGLSRTPWPVTIVGEGPMRSDLQALADRAAPGRVTLRGWSDDVPSLMRSAAVLALPSRWESFGYVVPEARAAGTPVVATRVDGPLDQIEDGRTGLLVAPDDPAALAVALDDVQNDPDLWDRLSVAGAEAVDHYPMDGMLAGLEQVYREAAGTAANVLVVRPAMGGVAHVASLAARELARDHAPVRQIVLDEGPASGWNGMRTAWRERAAIRRAGRVHVEFGRGAGAVFWFALVASLLRRDVAVVVHDLPLVAHCPAAALVAPGSRTRSRFVYRLLCPVVDPRARRLLIRRAGAVGVFSAAVVPAARRLGARSVVVLSHGAEPPSGGAPPSAGRAVVCCGFLTPGKGIDELVEAWGEVGPLTELPLLIVGEVSAENDDWARRLQDLGARMASPPLWLPPPDDDGFARLLSDAAVVVLPYRSSNPVSGVAVRAAVEGRPVVGTRVPALLEDVEHGVTGLLGAPRDAGELARHLERLLTDPPLRDGMGAAAARRAAQRHTWPHHVRGLEDLYRKAGTDA